MRMISQRIVSRTVPEAVAGRNTEAYIRKSVTVFTQSISTNLLQRVYFVEIVHINRGQRATYQCQQ